MPSPGVIHRLLRFFLCAMLPLPLAVVADTFVSEDVITEPVPENFSICHDHTCTQVTRVSLQPWQWEGIRKIFLPATASAEDERRRIAGAVAELERLVGPLTGTESDRGRNLMGVGEDGQMDCIDESTNTSIYLMMMDRDGLLRWHTVEDRVTRGFFIFGWPHTTAVIRERHNGQYYAVDSWFLDNGMPPYILPLQVWKDGWEPDV